MADSVLVSEKEQNLYRRLEDGDMAALTTLYHENRTAIHSLVRKNGGGPPDADDILHEALIVLWQRVRTGRFELRARMGTFVYATARNLWLRRLARRRKEQVSDLAGLDMADHSRSPLNEMVDTERSTAVRRCIADLPDPCRSLLIAYYWEELSMNDLAIRFGLANAQTAKSKKYQCKEELRKLIKRAL